MSQLLTGCHVFEKRKDDEWNELSFAVQVLSILSWKRWHGRCVLYTNEAHLADLKLRGIDVLYDYIDSHTLATMPSVDTKKWWALGKIYVAAQQTAPFAIIDTDLYLEQPLHFNDTLAFQGYHFEAIDPDF